MKPEEKDAEITETKQQEETDLQAENDASTNDVEVSEADLAENAQQDEEEQAEPDLETLLEQKDAEIADYVDRLKRVQADFQNYKKRKEKEQAEIYTMIEDRLLSEFLPLYDDFLRAFNNFKNEEEQTAFIEGMERIFAKFKDHLESKDIQQVDAVGKKFDPALHEVLLTVESDGDPHIVLEEFECGYTRKGRLLRPSRVTVSKPPAAPKPEPQEEPKQQDTDHQEVEAQTTAAASDESDDFNEHEKES